MRPAGQMGYVFVPCIFLVYGIPVRLQVPPEAAQYGQRCAAPAGGAVVKQYRSLQRGMVYPIVSLVGGALFIAVQYFYRGLIHLKIAFGFGVENELLIKRVQFDERFFGDRKSTRLDSSHVKISYDVF